MIRSYLKYVNADKIRSELNDKWVEYSNQDKDTECEVVEECENLIFNYDKEYVIPLSFIKEQYDFYLNIQGTVMDDDSKPREYATELIRLYNNMLYALRLLVHGFNERNYKKVKLLNGKDVYLLTEEKCYDRYFMKVMDGLEIYDVDKDEIAMLEKGESYESKVL